MAVVVVVVVVVVAVVVVVVAAAAAVAVLVLVERQWRRGFGSGGHHLAARALELVPVLEYVAVEGAEEAKDRARCAHGDNVGGEDGADHKRKVAARDEHEGDREMTVGLLGARRKAV